MMVKFKLNDGAAIHLREQLEVFLGELPTDYINLLEQATIGKLLKRKMAMFYYPKRENTLSLEYAEAAVLYRVLSCSSIDLNMNRSIIDMIGRKLPDSMLLSAQ